LRQENHEFLGTWDYIVRPCLKTLEPISGWKSALGKGDKVESSASPLSSMDRLMVREWTVLTYS
jgi:hypothetical protein